MDRPVDLAQEQTHQQMKLTNPKQTDLIFFPDLQKLHCLWITGEEEEGKENFFSKLLKKQFHLDSNYLIILII